MGNSKSNLNNLVLDEMENLTEEQWQYLENKVKEDKMKKAGKIFKETGKIPNDIGNRKWTRKLESLKKK